MIGFHHILTICLVLICLQSAHGQNEEEDENMFPGVDDGLIDDEDPPTAPPVENEIDDARANERRGRPSAGDGNGYGVPFEEVYPGRLPVIDRGGRSRDDRRNPSPNPSPNPNREVEYVDTMRSRYEGWTQIDGRRRPMRPGGAGGSRPSGSQVQGGDFTVSGQRCWNSRCTTNYVMGFWSCPIDGSNAWDYCCRPGHPCGNYPDPDYKGRMPWCYVGPADNDVQWRTCLMGVGTAGGPPIMEPVTQPSISRPPRQTTRFEEWPISPTTGRIVDGRTTIGASTSVPSGVGGTTTMAPPSQNQTVTTPSPSSANTTGGIGGATSPSPPTSPALPTSPAPGGNVSGVTPGRGGATSGTTPGAGIFDSASGLTPGPSSTGGTEGESPATGSIRPGGTGGSGVEETTRFREPTTGTGPQSPFATPARTQQRQLFQ